MGPLLAALLLTGASTPVDSWMAELAQSGTDRVLVARVIWDESANTVTLAPSTEGYESFAASLRDARFVEQLRAAQALTVSQTRPDGRLHLIFLNKARVSDTDESAILGHEIGHAWLSSRGFPFVPYKSGERACLSIHATDAVQHVLIRKAMAERGIDYETQWKNVLDQAVHSWQNSPPAPLSPCERARAVSQWVDVRVGLPEARWPGRPAYDRTLETRHPELAGPASAISELIQIASLDDPLVAAAVMQQVLEILAQVAAFPTTPPTTLKTNQ